jgi:hypothetical protein
LRPYYKLAVIQDGIQDVYSYWDLDALERIIIQRIHEGGVSQFLIWSEHPFKGRHDLFWFPPEVGGWNGGGP